MIQDIRQSEKWSEYLKYYGWNTLVFKDNYIRYIKVFGIKIAKLQRPEVLTLEDVEDLEKFCKDNRIRKINIFPSQNQDNHVFLQKKFKTKQYIDIPPSTSVINLKLSTKQLHNKLSRSAKYSINRANRENVITEFFVNPNLDSLKLFHKLSVETGLYKKFLVQPLGDYIKKSEIFKNNCVIAFSRDSEYNYFGGKMFLIHGNCAWFMHGATTKIGQKSKAGYKLLWDSIIFLKNMGLDYIDLEGVSDNRFKSYNKSSKGYSNFKLKFGGNIIIFPLPITKVLL